MSDGEASRPLRQDEDDAEDALDLPIIMNPAFSPRQNGHPNGKPPAWSRNRHGWRGRASLGRLFVSIRSLFCPTTTRTALSVALLTLLLGFTFWTTKTPAKTPGKTPALPPEPKPKDREVIFKEVLELERTLPQQNPNLPFPEGRKGRYINFSSHAWGSGWNNIVQEHLVTAHLAVLSRRAYVFPPHIAHEHPPFSDIPDLPIPFTAFAYGPITGQPFTGSRGSPDESRFTQDELLPRAVSEEYFHSVCSEKDTVKLSVEETAKELGVNVDQDSALKTMLAFAKKLREMDQPCVDIGGRPLFLWMLFGGPQLLPVWSVLESSPMYKDWDWSPLIHTTLEANGIPTPSDSHSARLRKSLPPTHPWAIKTDHKRSAALIEGPASNPNKARATDSGPYVIPKLVAVHVRRGDYEKHCEMLAAIKAAWTSWNAFGIYSRDNATLPEGFDPEEFNLDARWVDASYPKLADSIFDPPYSAAYPHDAEGKVDPTTLTRGELSFLHCWSRMDGIRDKLAAVRRAHPGLENVYLMTNGRDRWIGGMIELLLEDGWKSVRSSKELVLSDAAVAVSQAVDMAVGNWAEVFVGNGFSSMTSNTVGFRLAQGHPPDTIHFF